MPVRFGNSRVGGNRESRRTTRNLVGAERRHSRPLRDWSPAAAPEAGSPLDPPKLTRWIDREPIEVDTANVHVCIATVGDRYRYLNRLTGHHDTIVRQRFNAKARRQHGCLLELAFFLKQAKLDLATTGIVDAHGAQRGPHGADQVHPLHERLENRIVLPEVERTPGGDDRRFDCFKPLGQCTRGPGTRESG
jgi:hypothetical protein